MGTRTQHTQKLTCRVVLRGCCWLRNTRDSQLARGAAARLLCESGSVATALPLPTNWSVLFFVRIFLLSCARFRELFLLLWCQATVCAWHSGPARVLPAARAAAATPRRVTSKVQSSVSCFSPKAKSRGDYRDRFFLLILREFDFRLVFLATHLSAAPGSSSSSSSSSCSLKTTTVGARSSLWACPDD